MSRPALTESSQAAWRFALRFVGVAAGLFAIYAFPYAENGISERWFTAYLSAYARAVGAVLSLVEPSISVSGKLIYGRIALEIVKTCDAMEINILFCAAVAAFPGRLSRKLAVLLGGLAALIACNVLRICSLYFIGIHFPSKFELAHLEVLPLLFVVLTAGLFLLSTNWMRADEAPADN